MSLENEWQYFVCPLDHLPLQEIGKALRCPNAHSFDVAREGHCNLLLVQNKKSLEPGDNKEMVLARRRFLEGGYFSVLAERVSASVRELTSGPGFCVLDAGCGEGYYLRHLRALNPKLKLIGMDISKLAVQAAAKLSPDITWAVASNRSLPLEKGSMAMILSIFGFPVWKSFASLQGAGGYVLLLDPAENHLIELRKIIYPVITKSGPPSLLEAIASGYELLREENIMFQFILKENSAISDLLAMTPHGYRISAEARANVASLQRLALTAEFSLKILKRKI